MEWIDQALTVAFNLTLLVLLVRYPLASLSVLASGALHLWWPESYPWPLLVVLVGLLAEAARAGDRQGVSR